MHDIKLMVEKEIMKAMLTVHTLRWREKDTPPNIGICVIVLFAAWTKRTQGLGEAPTTVKRYRSLPVEFHVHILMTRVLTKESVLRMTYRQLERNFDRWWYSTLSIFRHSIFHLFLKMVSHDILDAYYIPWKSCMFGPKIISTCYPIDFCWMWSCPNLLTCYPVISRIAS